MASSRALPFVLVALLSSCVGERRSSSRGGKVEASLRSGTTLCLPAWGCDHVSSLKINGVEMSARCATGQTDVSLHVEATGARVLYECGDGKQVVYVEGTSYFHGCAAVASQEWASVPAFVASYPDLLACNDKKAVVQALARHGVSGSQVVRELLRRQKTSGEWAWTEVYYDLNDAERSAVADAIRPRLMATLDAGDVASFGRLFQAIAEPQKSQIWDDLLARFATNASAANTNLVHEVVQRAPDQYADKAIDVVQGLGASLPDEGSSLIEDLHKARPDDPRLRTIACTNLSKLGETSLRVLARTPGPRCADVERELRKRWSFTCAQDDLTDHALDNNGAPSALFTMLRKRRTYELQEARTLACDNDELPRGTKCHCSKTYCESLVSGEEPPSCKFLVDDTRKTIRSVKR